MKKKMDTTARVFRTGFEQEVDSQELNGFDMGRVIVAGFEN
jgi:hypothetical protein